ncbi:hypothetical protein LWI29_026571 [Acer saccharum]|uniref:Uncharacterized protein n=1 Tax=Acer saccharum TaxID=4024 RepID=A0AA39T7X2_ACESA|nr:hypothetical protein LWI29_026571 [Acer saccharum]
MDHNIGPGSLNLALVLVPEPKEVGFHIDLCSGPKTIKKTNRGKRTEGAKARVFGKEAKNIQLMMKRGLLMASLVHRRSDFRNLNANRIVYPSRRENLESKVFNALEEELEGGDSGKHDFKDSRRAGKDTGSNYDDPYSRRFVKGGLSYAEAVKEDDHRKTEVKKDLIEPEKGITMTWTGSYQVEEWLSRSAVGVLKFFGSVEVVNKMLDDRGFVFSSTFLGGKNIVWTFQTQCERDGFINNRIGEQVGEVLWIDGATECRRRLDVGKVLVLKQLGQVLEYEVVVKNGRNSSPVRIVECPTPVSKEWISNLLGLRLTFSKSFCRADRVGSDRVSSVKEGRPVPVREGSREDVTVNSGGSKDRRKGVREQSLRNPFFNRIEVGGEVGVLEKGKGQSYQKMKATNKQQKGGYGVVKIGTQRRSDHRGRSDESEYSSSGSESEDGPEFNGLWLKGECSNKRPHGVMEGSGPTNGCLDLGPFVSIDGSNYKERISVQDNAEGGGGFSGEISLLAKKMGGGFKKGCGESSTQSQTVSSIQVVQETQMAEEQGIDLVVDLRGQERGATVLEGTRMAVVCSESEDGKRSKTGGNCGSREGSENSNIRRAKRRKGKGKTNSIKLIL